MRFLTRVCTAALTIAVLGSLTLSHVAAQPRDAVRTQQARRLFESGNRAFAEERYRDALGYFEGAYELSHRPVLLYNVGRAAEEAGDRARALTAYRAYLTANEQERREEVELRIRTLERAEQPALEPNRGNEIAAAASSDRAEHPAALSAEPVSNPGTVCGDGMCIAPEFCSDNVRCCVGTNCREMKSGADALPWVLGGIGAAAVIGVVVVLVVVLGSQGPTSVTGDDGRITQTLVEARF